MFREFPYYQNYHQYYPFGSGFVPTYYPNNTISKNQANIDSSKLNPVIPDLEQEIKNNDESKLEENSSNLDSSSKKQFRLGPLSICSSSIDILGFHIEIDDLILIGLIILLLFQSDTDYILIIILGLILFNIDFSSLNLL